VHAVPGYAIRAANLLERDELRRRGGTNTGATVTHGLVRDRELAQVVANHVGLDLNRGEDLAVVHADDRADHLRHNEHVAQVRLDDVRLVVRAAVLLGLAQLLEQRHALALNAAREPPACARVHQINQLLGGQVEQIVQVDATVRELAEGTLLLQLERRRLLIIFSNCWIL